jgi:hypothetical protein
MKKNTCEFSKRVIHGLTFIFLIITTLHVNDLKSQNFSTRGEIYDYEVGDIFHYYSEASSFWNSGFQDVTNIEIIDKYYNAQEDTINYIRIVQNRRRDLYDGNFSPWEYSYITDSISYTDLDSLIISCLQCYTYSDSSYYNGRLINRLYRQYIEQNVYEKYVVGCGRAEYNLSDANYGYIDSVLVYYKKGNEEWGQQLIVGINEHKNMENDIEIYPNPAESDIYIKSDRLLIGTVSIYSQYGQLIENIYLNKNLIAIDISELKPNIYILEFNLADRVITKKIIKK